MSHARLPLAVLLFATVVGVVVAIGFARAQSDGERVACAAGLQSQVLVADFDRIAGPYLSQASDIVPDGARPARTALKKAARNPGFPRAGRGVAYLLVDEQGAVQQAVVTCATSADMVAPIEAALRDARLGHATRDGQPVKAAVYVEFELGG